MIADMLARTIQIIIAPVVMLTTCAITLGALQGRYTSINDRLRLMSSERLNLLRTLHVPIVPIMPAVSAVQPVSDGYAEERLVQLDTQLPQLLQRHHLAHNAVVLVYAAMLVFIVSMFVIAGSVATSAAWIPTLALIIFLCGVTVLFLGIAMITKEVLTSHQVIQYEVKRVIGLGASHLEELR